MTAMPSPTPDILSRQSDFVIVSVMGQLFGIPVLEVRDVLGPQQVANIPLAPPEVAGSLNLRGRIVTAIDVRRRLGLPERAPGQHGMSVVVDYQGELYSLIIDSASEVMSLPIESYEENPATLDPRWKEIAGGIYSLADQLLIVLNIGNVLTLSPPQSLN